jgi:hypothetical protein
VSLEDGKSAHRRIEIRTVRATGQVERGGGGVRARLTFRHTASGQEFKAQSEDTGLYRADLSLTGHYGVTIDGDDFSGFIDQLTVPDSTAIVQNDFVIPARRYRVRVTEAATGKPVPAAKVGYAWQRKRDDEIGSWTDAVAVDADGRARLRPVGSGVLSLWAAAEGFRAGETKEVEVREDSKKDRDEEREIALTLEKSDRHRFRILDFSGRPVPGSVLAAPAVASKPADSNGLVTLDEPISPGQPFVVFGGEGQLGFFRFSGEDEQILGLSLAGPAFVVRFQAPDGRPFPGRHLLLAVDGIAIPDDPPVEWKLKAGWDLYSRRDGTHRVGGLPVSGELTIWPHPRSDLAVARRLPVTETIVFYLDQ